MKRLARIAGFFIPHFATDEAVVNFGDCDCGEANCIEVVCLVEDVQPGERFDGIVTLRAFAFLWWGFYPQQIGKVRTFVNPHDEVGSAKL